jgi:hypothetical protein
VSDKRLVTLEHWHRGKVGERGRLVYQVIRQTKTQLLVYMGGYTVRLRLKDGFPTDCSLDRTRLECMYIPPDVLKEVVEHGPDEAYRKRH